MMRFFVPSLVVLFAGCCWSQPGTTAWTNPFDYNSRIAPPPTGTAVPGAVPYYQPPPTQPPPVIQGNASQPTPAVAKVEPRTTVESSNTVETRTTTATSEKTGFREVASSDTQSKTETTLVAHTEPAKATTPIRIAEPPQPTLSCTASGSSRTPSAPRDISTLPPALPPATTAASDSRPNASQSRTNFGYRPDYTTLQGRLEYSASSDQWKLRYIPIDGKTDRFGGSVVLIDKQRMVDFEHGDFVAVDGEVGRDGQDTVGYAPAYHLNSIRRL